MVQEGDQAQGPIAYHEEHGNDSGNLIHIPYKNKDKGDCDGHQGGIEGFLGFTPPLVKEQIQPP